ncbi:hypothetical protein YQ44_21400 [Janthinobacterium sp. 1_2014MBL_MicDiv]|nr:hypothetical protein YQ44_21400 [Janthinobacterium sp. 1_2014MBL_MicDiv]
MNAGIAVVNSFCMGLGAHCVNQLCVLAQITAELSEVGLQAIAHTGEHEHHQGRQRQFSPSLKRCRVLRMTRAVTKLVGIPVVGKIEEKAAGDMVSE